MHAGISTMRSDVQLSETLASLGLIEGTPPETTRTSLKYFPHFILIYFFFLFLLKWLLFEGLQESPSRTADEESSSIHNGKICRTSFLPVRGIFDHRTNFGLKLHFFDWFWTKTNLVSCQFINRKSVILFHASSPLGKV